MRAPKKEQADQMRGIGYVTAAEAAARTGVPKSSLYDAIRGGDIEVDEIGRRKWVKVASLLAYVGESGAKLWKACASMWMDPWWSPMFTGLDGGISHSVAMGCNIRPPK